MQAVIASAAGCGSGLATTSAVGAEKMVIAAAIVAASMTATTDFNMTAPCFGVSAGAFLLSAMITIGLDPCRLL